MAQYAKTKRGRKYFYYRCSRDAKRAVSECPIRQVTAAELERAVFAQLAASMRSPEMLARLAEITGEDGVALAERIGPRLWEEATNDERRRIAEMLVERVTCHGIEDKFLSIMPVGIHAERTADIARLGYVKVYCMSMIHFQIFSIIDKSYSVVESSQRRQFAHTRIRRNSLSHLV